MLHCSPEVDIVPVEIETVVTENNDKDNDGSTKTEEVIKYHLLQYSAVIETV